MDEHENLSHRQQNGSKLRARCPECRTWIDLKDDIEQWDQVDCPQCDALLELTDWRPLTLSVVELDDDELVYDDDDFSGNYRDDDAF